IGSRTNHRFAPQSARQVECIATTLRNAQMKGQKEDGSVAIRGAEPLAQGPTKIELVLGRSKQQGGPSPNHEQPQPGAKSRDPSDGTKPVLRKRYPQGDRDPLEERHRLLY